MWKKSIVILGLVINVWCKQVSPELEASAAIHLANLNDDRSANESVAISYEGTQLWRISISDNQERDAVSELAAKYDGKTWISNGEILDILVHPQDLVEIEQELQKSNLSHVVLIDNLQNIINKENPPKEEIEALQNRKGHRMTWRAYHRLSDIHGFLDYFSKTYPELCTVHRIGNSAQSRPLKLIKISNRNPNNKKVWIDGGIHAREWISPASVTYIVEQLVEGYEDLPNYMKDIDWYIVPLLNPDGYEHTQYDRLWRKNRRSAGQCVGADLNRNFGYKWGGPGSSRNPCAETFGGNHAFSEPETAAVEKFLSAFGYGKFKAFLTFHSYGQYILYPWGHDKSKPVDYRDLDRVGKEAAANMLRIGGARYQVGSSGALLYPAAGGSDDWARGVLGVKYAYTVEMRDTGRYGFILPASLIEVTSKEAWVFVKTVAKAVQNN